MRGKGRDQRFLSLVNGRGHLLVSVPLRGKGREQLYKQTLVQEQAISLMFPSPCGEKVGINRVPDVVTHHIPEWVLFPSPCGEKVGINQNVVRKSKALTAESFRPLAGKR